MNLASSSNDQGLIQLDILKQQAEIIGALELGVLPPGDVNEMLKTLSAEEAYTTKRKFRKLKRKLFRQAGVPTYEASAALGRVLVQNKCRRVGEQIICGKKER